MTPVPARDFSNTFKKAPIQKAPPEGIKIDDTNFPDEIFREQIVRPYDFEENGGDGNGFLNEDELSKMAFLFLYRSDFPTIADLHGLNYFTSLQLLTVEDKPLLKKKIDVSGLSYLESLLVYFTGVSEITFGANSSLSSLLCPLNKLTSLDVQTLTNLYDLSCYDNQLTNLTLGRHPQLKTLLCFNNLLSTLSLNQCENLKDLQCNDNQLTTLDLSNNPDLEYLTISNNHLTSLDLSKNLQLRAKNFKGEHQTYSIEVDRDTLEFDLSSLPGNFIPARASDWKGASVSGMTLNLDPSMPATVTYNYDADRNRPGFIMDVTLFVTYVSRNILIPCPYGAVICPTQPAYQTIPLTPVPVQQKSVDNIQGQVAQLPKTGEQDSRAVAISSLLLLSLGAFFMISRRK
ncbi:MAG: LPXTG cell wall anchor domain-containing protein [Clostridiales bacterium]|nr:LPXTG cell wall anchor domain-containing protein [Clostridiales bacterium]MDD7433027.1 LPXTG cell wall anchor domain-containing protein [Clostridiales bacterium]MDY3061742.1 LPXTG cell wall anchor domain-containing protein [Eubacteriales bacterium]